MEKFDSTCRTCNATRSNLVNIFANSIGNDSCTLNEILYFVCPSISIQKDDKLPQKICFFCSKQLEIAYKFQQQCKKSDEELWQIVKDTMKEEVPQPESIEDTDLSEKEPIDDVPIAEEDFENKDTINGSPEFLDETEVEDVIEIFPESDPVSITESAVQGESSSKACFTCEICEKEFLTSGGLVLHVKLSHKNLNSDKPKAPCETFGCKYCDQVFDSPEQQLLHTQSEHKSNSKSELTCPICRKVFVGKSKLDHHLMYHQKSQFKCWVKDCNRTFVIKYKLTDHLKRFHGILVNQSKVIQQT